MKALVMAEALLLPNITVPWPYTWAETSPNARATIRFVFFIFF